MCKFIKANLWQINKYKQKRNKNTRGKLKSAKSYTYGVLLGTILEQKNIRLLLVAPSWFHWSSFSDNIIRYNI